MSPRAFEGRDRPWLQRFERLHLGDPWFEVYRIEPGLFAIREPRHAEETLVSLLVGDHDALLIDTGCGIGDLCATVEEITDLPVQVVNTHTHLDHVAGNGEFDEVVMFDHSRARTLTAHGADDRALRTELYSEHLVAGEWPSGFDPARARLEPFPVSRWLREGDVVEHGGSELEVIQTPGEAPDHVVLLDRCRRILFCGDILLRGAVWTHLNGGSVDDLVRSYDKLMTCVGEFDHVMPGHNDPWLPKSVLFEASVGLAKVRAGDVEGEPVVDSWGREAVRYRTGGFELLTRRD